MAKIKLNGDTSGYIEISAPAVSGNNTLELGPGTKILTNLDNTFTGVSTFTSGLHVTGGGFILNQQRSDTHTSLIIDKPDAGTGTLKFFNNGSGSAYIQHTGAEHLHYYLPSGSGYHAFYTNGTERLRIDDVGRLTITGQGLKLTTNNSSLYTLDGSLSYYATNNAVYLNGAGTNGWLRLNASGPENNQNAINIFGGNAGAHIDMRTNNVERLRITSDGKVIIGATSAGGLFSVHQSASSANYINITNGVTGTSSWSNGMLLGPNSSGDALVWQNENSALRFGTNNLDRMRITAAGDVGIGENTPADRLVVQKANASGDVAARIKNDTTTDGSASTPTTASLYLTTSTGDFNTFYIQARRNDNDTHFGYSNPRDGGHTPNMIISNEGRVTVPNQPAFSVRRNGNQSIPHNTRTRVSWNAEIFDVGGNFDSSTNYRFTAPVAGKYLFMGHLYVYSTHQVEAFVYKNGASYKRFSGPLGTGSNDNPNGIDFMDIVDLSVNDFIEIHALHARTGDSSTVSIYGGNEKETSFVGYLLG